MEQLKTMRIRNYFIFSLLLLSACGSSSSNNESDATIAQPVTHALLNGIWETGCIVNANDENTSSTVSDVYLDGTRTSDKTFYADGLCSIVNTMETVNASYTLGDDVTVDPSIAGLSIATIIEFKSDDPSLPMPFFDLIAIKNDTVTTLYTGDVSSPATDGSSLEKSPKQLKSSFSAIKHNNVAEVVSVTTSGAASNYTFAVGVFSPETGCNQYADWWEVISESGELIYRRVLLHSHIDEQPFIRTGGPVTISNEQIVIIRAHMSAHTTNSNAGYGIKAYKGSINNGFAVFETEQNFAAGLASQEPLPVSCLF